MKLLLKYSKHILLFFICFITILGILLYFFKNSSINLNIFLFSLFSSFFIVATFEIFKLFLNKYINIEEEQTLFLNEDFYE